MKNRARLYAIYIRIRAWVAPSLKYSQEIYQTFLQKHVPKNCRWLDLGCGHHLLPEWKLAEEKALVGRGTVVGLDYDFHSLTKHRTISARVRGDITALPFRDESFDVVTANMVFEHLDKPEVQLREIFRVLRPEGTLIFHTPNVWGYTTAISMLVPEKWKSWLIRVLENRVEEDVFTTFYRINSPKTIERIARDNGFAVEELRMVVTDAQFAVIPPLAFMELLWIRMLMTRILRGLRPNIIVRLRKPAPAAAQRGAAAA